MEDAVRQALRGNEQETEYIYENARDAPGYQHMEIYETDDDSTTVADYIEKAGWTDERVNQIARSPGPLTYRNYQSPIHHPTVRELAIERVLMDAPRLADAIMPALDYTWSVSTDMGRTARNPTDEEKENLRRELSALCRDCGDAQRASGPSAGFDCGHIAHPSCHTPAGALSCALATGADPDVRIPLRPKP